MAVFHGGNLASAAQSFGVPVQGWLDLSTGINPVPYPIPDIANNLWTRLPDQDVLDDLKAAACQYYEVGGVENIIPVSGTQTLLQIFPHLFEKPKSVRIVGPTYKEHEYCWRLAGHDVAEVGDLFEAVDQGDIVIVVNPNNPTGDVYAPDTLLDIARQLHAKGGLLIVDEAFGDCAPSLGVAGHIGAPGLVALRSFGKFFGLAGIRLGFVLASGELADRLKDGIGPWAVNGPAMEIARRALRDTAWIKKTRQDLVKATARLDEILVRGGMQIVGGTSLFRYCYHEQATRVYESLGRHGILVRPFEDQPGYLRVGLAGDEAGWQRLNIFMQNFSL